MRKSLTLGSGFLYGHERRVDEQAATHLLIKFDQVKHDDAELAALARDYMEILIRQAGRL